MELGQRLVCQEAYPGPVHSWLLCRSRASIRVEAGNNKCQAAMQDQASP